MIPRQKHNIFEHLKLTNAKSVVKNAKLVIWGYLNTENNTNS